MALFEGAGVALITPFKDNGEVNYEKLEERWKSRLPAVRTASSSVEPPVRHPP